MTKLELCKRLRQEASVSGNGPTTTLSQDGEMLRLVNWIEYAYEDIQNQRQDWRFLLKDFSFTLTLDKPDYTPTEAGLTALANWKRDSFRVYDNTLGVNDEAWLYYLDYDDHFRDTRGFGSMSTQTGKPIEFSIKPDNSLIIYPIPDASTYVIRGQYYQTPREMASDASTPVFPTQYHMMIVWRALREYALYESAQELLAKADQNYALMFTKFVNETQSPFIFKHHRTLC